MGEAHNVSLTSILVVGGADHGVKAMLKFVSLAAVAAAFVALGATNVAADQNGTIAAAVATDAPLNMSLEDFLTYCNAGNMGSCITKLGDDVGEDTMLSNTEYACWPCDASSTAKNCELDDQQVGRQMYSWISAHPERVNDKTADVESDAESALYPCLDQ